MKVLQLAEGCYYVKPKNEFSNFGSVGVPYLASVFSDSINEMPPEVVKVFKDAKFIEIEISWKIKK